MNIRVTLTKEKERVLVQSQQSVAETEEAHSTVWACLSWVTNVDAQF